MQCLLFNKADIPLSRSKYFPNTFSIENLKIFSTRFHLQFKLVFGCRRQRQKGTWPNYSRNRGQNNNTPTLYRARRPKVGKCFFVCSRSWDWGLDSEFSDLVWQLNRTCGSHLASLSHFPLSRRSGAKLGGCGGGRMEDIPRHKSHNFCMKLSCALARLYCRQSTRLETSSS